MHRALAIGLLAWVGVSSAQAPGAPYPEFWGYYAYKGDLQFSLGNIAIDAPLTLTKGADGRAHLGVANVLTVTSQGSPVGAASSVDLQAGQGVLFALTNTPQAILIQPSIDTSIIAHRVAPPTASGPALDPTSGQPLGTGAWAADSSFFYFVVPNATNDDFIWARVPLTTTW